MRGAASEMVLKLLMVIPNATSMRKAREMAATVDRLMISPRHHDGGQDQERDSDSVG
jgi:hypothetical protein